jgi:hypothetical protein
MLGLTVPHALAVGRPKPRSKLFNNLHQFVLARRERAKGTLLTYYLRLSVLWSTEKGLFSRLSEKFIMPLTDEQRRRILENKAKAEQRLASKNTSTLPKGPTGRIAFANTKNPHVRSSSSSSSSSTASSSTASSSTASSSTASSSTASSSTASSASACTSNNTSRSGGLLTWLGTSRGACEKNKKRKKQPQLYFGHKVRCIEGNSAYEAPAVVSGLGKLQFKRPLEPKLGDIASVLENLSKSRPQCLGEPLKLIVAHKGMHEMLTQARAKVVERLEAAWPHNDGVQTPDTQEDPVDVAQHASAACCRQCAAQWHAIPKGVPLTSTQVAYLTECVRLWLSKQISPAEILAIRRTTATPGRGATVEGRRQGVVNTDYL